MRLGDGLALLVLSGRGRGKGVEHFSVPISYGDAYPPETLLESWCSLGTTVIPTRSNDLVLMIARQATSNGVPWTILSEYAQVRNRQKHYAGVSLILKEHTIPATAIPIVHNVLEAMIHQNINGQHFVSSLEDWSPPLALIDQLKDIAVEHLDPKFTGIQPGQEIARIFHSVYPDVIVADAQKDPTYSNYCSAFVFNREGEPDNPHCFVSSKYSVSFIDSVDEIASSSSREKTKKSNRVATIYSHRNADYDDTVYENNDYTPSLAKLSSDLENIQKTVRILQNSVASLRQEIENKEHTQRVSGKLELGIIIVFGMLLMFAVSQLWNYASNEISRPIALPAGESYQLESVSPNSDISDPYEPGDSELPSDRQIDDIFPNSSRMLHDNPDASSDGFATRPARLRDSTSRDVLNKPKSNLEKKLPLEDNAPDQDISGSSVR